MEHGLLEHGSRLDQSVLHVPLMLWGDSVPAGRRVSANVGQIDVLPTILDFMGVEAPREIQGLSLRPLLAVDDVTPGAFAQRPLFSEARAPFGIQTGKRAVAVQTPGLSVRLGAMKLVRYTNADGEFIYEFYDVASDPGDEVDLAPGRGDQWKELALLLSQHQEASDRFRTRLEGGGAIESQTAPLDPEHEAKLRALGYIE
jgi:arylsulfatase A-like enzyme